MLGLEEIGVFTQRQGVYALILGAEPRVAALGLNDSPVGLAGWIVEKFRRWSDCGGDVERRFTKDELLTNVTLYWAAETIKSSFGGRREAAISLSKPRRPRIGLWSYGSGGAPCSNGERHSFGPAGVCIEA